MTVQTFPISSIARWGSWTVNRNPGPNDSSAMNSDECEFAFSFIGTRAEMYWGADSGADNYVNTPFVISIDGAPFQSSYGISGVSGSSPSSWFPLSIIPTANAALPDARHTIVVRLVYQYYSISCGWNLSVPTAIRITGATPACAPLPYRSAPGGKVIIFDGDSRTLGTGSTDATYGGEPFSYNNIAAANKGYSYPADFHRSFLDGTWTAVNQGCYSDLATHMLYREPTDVLTQLDPANARNVVVFWGGVNDLNTGTTPAALQQTVSTYIGNLKTAGVKEIILGTIPYTPGGGSNPANISAYNASLRANWRSMGASALADVDADPAFSGHVGTADWDQDGLHLSNSGYTKTAAIFASAFNNQVFGGLAPPPLYVPRRSHMRR